MARYRVTVIDHRVLDVYLEAESEEDAKRLVEESDDMYNEFQVEHSYDSTWHVDLVERYD